MSSLTALCPRIQNHPNSDLYKTIKGLEERLDDTAKEITYQQNQLVKLEEECKLNPGLQAAIIKKKMQVKEWGDDGEYFANHIDFLKEFLPWLNETCTDAEFSGRLDLSQKMYEIFKERVPELRFVGARTPEALTSFPKSIGELSHLTHIVLRGHNFTNLPSEIWKLKNLQHLDLSCNLWLSGLSPDVRHLTQLKNLALMGNRLLSLPPEIGKLEQLEDLGVSDNLIEALPPEFCNLSKLKILTVDRNRLRGIPGALANLSSRCTIFAFQNHFSQEAIVAFQRQVEQQRAINPALGPILQCSIFDHDYTQTYENTTIEEAIDFWLNQFRINFAKDSVSCKALEGMYTCEDPKTDLRLQSFLQKLDPIEQGKLKQYLISLKRTEDFKHPLACQGLILNTVRMLDGACTNEAFRKMVMHYIGNALGTCGDRAADTYDDIHLLWLLYCNSKEMSINKLASLLIGRKRLGIVFDFAEKKIKEKSLPDPISTHLYCKTKLKDKLDLPVATEGMLYPKTAGITDEELVEAEELARKQTSPEHLFGILMSEEFWQEALMKEHEQEFAKINDEANEKIIKLMEQERKSEVAQVDIERKNLIAQRMEELTRNRIQTYKS
jgi:Leucine-rich repeat (LRR) protein